MAWSPTINSLLECKNPSNFGRKGFNIPSNIDFGIIAYSKNSLVLSDFSAIDGFTSNSHLPFNIGLPALDVPLHADNFSVSPAFAPSGTTNFPQSDGRLELSAKLSSDVLFKPQAICNAYSLI